MDKNLLILAAVNSDLDSIKSLIRDGVDINYTDKFGDNCLTTACHYDNDEIVSYLIQSGVDLDRKNDKDDTAIHRCVKKRSFKCLKLLLDNGAQVDVRSNGLTPLLAACDTKRAPVMEYLFETCTRSAKIEALEYMGAKCVKEGDFESACGYWSRSLEERAKAEPGDLLHPKSAEKHPVFGNSPEFDTLEELNTIASSEEDMWMQALIITERILGSNNLDIYSEFVEQACDYLGEDDYGKCLPLWMYMLDVQLKSLSGSLHRTTSNTLLSLNNLVSVMASEEPPAPCKYVMSVLHKAVHVSELIMKHHVANEPRSDDYHMENVILLALNSIGFLAKFQLELSETDKIKFHEVINEFVRLNPRDIKHRTPLHLVFKLSDGSSFSFEVAQLLLEAGTDPGVVDDDGNTPLHIACMQREPSPATLKVVKLLLESGVDHGAGDCDGSTPLHLICTQREISNSSLEVVKLLLEAGADPGAVNREGRSPLHGVCTCRQSSKPTLELIELLLKAGAKPGAVDTFGNTPLHLACDNANPSFSILEVVRLLLEAGANPGVVNREGNTALQLVSNNDHPAQRSVMELPLMRHQSPQCEGHIVQPTEI